MLLLKVNYEIDSHTLIVARNYLSQIVGKALHRTMLSTISYCLSICVDTSTGPLPNTMEDFWRMIWENRLSTVVMLTRCYEDRVRIYRFTAQR